MKRHHDTRRWLAGLVVAATGFVSCISAPEEQEIRTADYGRSVFLWEAEERLREKMAKRVTFPETSKNWRWSPLRRGWVKIGVFGTPAYGWILHASAAHRNIVGGDTRQQIFCLFHDGRVVRVWDGTEVNLVWGYVDDPKKPTFP